ncbi:hypothetical protein [Williamsia deligens]|uniref:Uncharacterized protein n=1 Tax=Williamsia deligens TaxID=321325 RepID=A0ABW3G9P7_9NOCA|nr:hypothetical protein [Williamsia deligens]MCP2195767.1 hypothetical protein [Williamsia deligens]
MKSAGRRSSRACLAGVVATATALIAGCSTAVDGTARVDAADASAYRADVSSSAQAASTQARERADYTACSTATSSVVTMLRSYNSFVTALNATQDYAALKGADLAAVDALTRGAGAVRGALATDTGPQVRSAAVAVADRSDALAGVVRAKGRGELNAASGGFLRARDDLLAVCRPVAAPTSSVPSTSAAAPPPAPTAPR